MYSMAGHAHSLDSCLAIQAALDHSVETSIPIVDVRICHKSEEQLWSNQVPIANTFDTDFNELPMNVAT